MPASDCALPASGVGSGTVGSTAEAEAECVGDGLGAMEMMTGVPGEAAAATGETGFAGASAAGAGFGGSEAAGVVGTGVDGREETGDWAAALERGDTGLAGCAGGRRISLGCGDEGGEENVVSMGAGMRADLTRAALATMPPSAMELPASGTGMGDCGGDANGVMESASLRAVAMGESLGMRVD